MNIEDLGNFKSFYTLEDLDNYKPTLYEKICWKLEKMYDFFRYNIPYGILNLIQFFNVIWKFRKWDFDYDLAILERILKLRLENHLKFDIHADKDDVTKLLNDLLAEINNIRNDDYKDLNKFSKLMNKYNTLWW